ncbi:LacI family transcriptional regulator [Vallitalea longa]|uniref:LacI family transcriptional regulator n=1 Tax=Vallitalea longa TaxID=2936439 RepID=A0A9W6DG59_9FIRM|nr:LacI family DNA-binding transcriptional regulator [Vallitalea longa]GKX29404.1 LacI family transcriptional regulator [Vallitalea longa]
MKSVKIIDVANKAGVSKSTVSQYLNGRYEYMSKATKQKIKRVIEDLNYIPNPIARSLKTDKTNTIGLIVRDITGYFTSSVIRGIDDYCKQNNYNVIIYNTDYDPAIEKKSISILKMLRVDGIIIASSGHNNKLLKEEINNGTSIVQMHMEYDSLDISTVLSDYKTGAYEATKYLIESGHKKIALLTQEYKSVRSRYDRVLGYENALIAHEIEVNEDLIYIWNRSSGIENNFEDLLDKYSPTALFTMHSSITIELLNYLAEKNIKVPDDISVLGFDELPLANLLKTPITVVNQSTYEIGQKAAELLLWKIAHKGNKQTEKILLPCNLIIRKSCKKIN